MTESNTTKTYQPRLGLAAHEEYLPFLVEVSFELFGKVFRHVILPCTKAFHDLYIAEQITQPLKGEMFFYASRSEDYYALSNKKFLETPIVFFDHVGYSDLKRAIENGQACIAIPLPSGPIKETVEPEELIFTLVGSRETPEEVAAVERDLAIILLRCGWTGYSGGSGLSDKQLERAYFANHYRRIAQGPICAFLPWTRFDGLDKYKGGVVYYDASKFETYSEAKALAKKFYDVYHDYDSLSQGAKSMMNRNVYQIHGPNLKQLTKVVICWAKPSTKTGMYVNGGTNLAVALGVAAGVPIINLYHPWELEKCLALIEMFKRGRITSIRLADLLSEPAPLHL